MTHMSSHCTLHNFMADVHGSCYIVDCFFSIVFDLLVLPHVNKQVFNTSMLFISMALLSSGVPKQHGR